MPPGPESNPVMTPRPTTREPADISLLVLASLRRIIRAIDLHSRSLVQRYGLTGPQLVLLKQLEEGPPRPVCELAQAVNLSQATVTGILDRLERKRLITRSRSSDDKRKVMISPTPEARVVIAGAPPLLQEHFIESFAELADWEQSQILSSLQRLVALMEADQVEAGPILTTGPLDASPERTRAFLGSPPADRNSS